MKKFTLFVAMFFASYFAVNNLQAQDYKSAIGLRLGSPLSISYKTFLNEKAAIELTGGFRKWTYYSWFNVGAYYQHHMPISSVDGLKWYVGGGANAYFWTYDDTYFAGQDNSKFSLGISGCIGLDYKFNNLPLNLSVDWIPTFFVNGYGNGFAPGYGALAVRYTF